MEGLGVEGREVRMIMLVFFFGMKLVKVVGCWGGGWVLG